MAIGRSERAMATVCGPVRPNVSCQRVRDARRNRSGR